VTDMRDKHGWTRITCAERDEHYKIAGDMLEAVSSLTDLDGIYGAPVVFTEWARKDQDEPLLRDYRYPRSGLSDAKPCEHLFYIGGIS